MMRKSVFKYYLLILSLVCLGSCSKETAEPAPATEPETVTIHYRATIEGGAQTKADLNEQMKYVFEAGDKVFMETTNGKMYGFLSLSLPSSAGKSVALFEGDLVCDINFRPEDDTEVKLTLMSPSDAVHSVSETGRIIIQKENKAETLKKDPGKDLYHTLCCYIGRVLCYGLRYV